MCIINKSHRLVDLNSKYLFLTVLEAGNPKAKPWQVQCLAKSASWFIDSCLQDDAQRAEEREEKGWGREGEGGNKLFL